MSKKWFPGDEVWYKIKSDDIRKGKIKNYAPNVNGNEYYSVTGTDFWFKPEQLFNERKDAEKE